MAKIIDITHRAKLVTAASVRHVLQGCCLHFFPDDETQTFRKVILSVMFLNEKVTLRLLYHQASILPQQSAWNHACFSLDKLLRGKCAKVKSAIEICTHKKKVLRTQSKQANQNSTNFCSFSFLFSSFSFFFLF